MEFLTLILYPYIDANILVYGRIEKRIEILDKVTKLDTKVISSNAFMQQEYESILKELGEARDKFITNIANTNDTSEDKKIKFISGGILFWIVSFFVLFSKNRNTSSKLKKVFNNIVSTALCVGFGYVLAVVGRSIPTFFNVWINVIAFPVVQIVIVALLVYGTKDK